MFAITDLFMRYVCTWVDSKLKDLSVPIVEYSLPARLTDVTGVKVCFSLIRLQLVQVKWQNHKR